LKALPDITLAVKIKSYWVYMYTLLSSFTKYFILVA